MTVDYFRTLARYNSWANARLHAAVAELPEAAYRQDRGAFFGSIHGTLNHLLVGDLIWLCRLAGEPDPVDRLDHILHPDFPSLRSARETTDARIEDAVAAIDAARLDTDLAFGFRDGSKGRVPHRFVLGHLFNHQTHHRGQVHDMLSQAGAAPPQLDLIYFLREDD